MSKTTRNPAFNPLKRGESETISDRDYIEDRIEVDPVTECWNWQGFKDGKGYGRSSLSQKRFGRQGAHQHSYLTYNGDIPAGMQVMHMCDNPSCCNPHHLKLGTHAENMADMVAKGRRAGVKVKLTDAQVKEVRQKYKPTVVTIEMLAKEYGVHVNTISYILRGLSRKNVK
jgi:hypothetical protein